MGPTVVNCDLATPYSAAGLRATGRDAGSALPLWRCGGVCGGPALIFQSAPGLQGKHG